MFWRFVGGFGIAGGGHLPMQLRGRTGARAGRLSSLFQFAIAIGIFTTQLVNSSA